MMEKMNKIIPIVLFVFLTVSLIGLAMSLTVAFKNFTRQETRQEMCEKVCAKYGHDWSAWKLEKLQCWVPLTWERHCETCFKAEQKLSWSSSTPDATEAMYLVVKEVVAQASKTSEGDILLSSVTNYQNEKRGCVTNLNSRTVATNLPVTWDDIAIWAVTSNNIFPKGLSNYSKIPDCTNK